MPFNGSEGSYISLAEGAAMTKLFRENFLKDGRVIKAFFYGKDKLTEILSQPECVGIRCYFGAESVERSGQSIVEVSLVLVGAKADQNDMISATDKILDDGSPCPMLCSTANPLNS